MSRKKEVLVRFDAEQLDALRVKAAEWGQTPAAPPSPPNPPRPRAPGRAAARTHSRPSHRVTSQRTQADTHPAPPCFAR